MILGAIALLVAAALLIGWPRAMAELQIALRSFMYKEPPQPSGFAVVMNRVFGVLLLVWGVGLLLWG